MDVAAAAGFPSDQYLYTVRQDPDAPNLLFLTTKSTVYVSFDGAAHWQPLTLNLPNVQVRDVAINTREGKVVIATHGRSLWVLDNLALLEQLTKRAAGQRERRGALCAAARVAHARVRRPGLRRRRRTSRATAKIRRSARR